MKRGIKQIMKGLFSTSRGNCWYDCKFIDDGKVAEEDLGIVCKCLTLDNVLKERRV